MGTRLVNFEDKIEENGDRNKTSCGDREEEVRRIPRNILQKFDREKKKSG